MLNETWRVWRALEKLPIHVDIEMWHPLIHPLSNYERNLLRVRLNEDGDVVSVEDIGNDERIGIMKIVQTSDGSFPVIKVNQPLFNSSITEKFWDKTDREQVWQDILLGKELKDSDVRSWQDAGWQWNSSLEKANLILKKLKKDEQASDVVAVAESFKKALQTDHIFIKQIVIITLSHLKTGRLVTEKTVKELIIGKGKDTNGRDKKISVSLALDIYGNESIYKKVLWEKLAIVLPTNLSATKREHKHVTTVSSFGGQGNLLTEPFPQVKLPVLKAYFPLVSMASDGDKAKCQKRYGLTEYTICPVTSTQTRQMGGALDWLVTREEGTTWRGVANGKFKMDARTRKKTEDRDLLIVFVDEKPQLNAKTASYFGSGNEVIGAQFEVDSKVVCDAFDAVVQEYPKSKLNLFLIRKASDGQAQIALSESPLVKDVLEAAKRWQKAVRENVPDVTLYLQPDKKKEIPEVRDARPLAPYPDQVVRLLSYQCVRDGSSPKGKGGKPQRANQPIIGPGLGDVLALMLRMEGKWEPAARNMLSLLIRRVGSLLIGLFGAKHAFGPRHAQGNPEPFFDYARFSRETALRAVALLGIILDALNSRKEEYMKEVPYQVGQILALADTLHKDYCIVVRSGQMPNSLIGTSLMRRALDSPAGALADLSERMMEYVRWAKIAQISSDWPQGDQRLIAVNEARKKLRQYGTLAAALDSSDMPTECNDVMKAQLLLGFLANPPEE